MKLKELEKKYLELGKEIEALKAKKEVYPIYCLSNKTGLVVKFDGLTSGVVVKQNDEVNVGYYSDSWWMHTDNKVWESAEEKKWIHLEVCPITCFFDGQLVFCWDNSTTHSRALLFYDAKNECCYTVDGSRRGSKWENYEPYEGNYPQWAQEAFKTLKI